MTEQLKQLLGYLQKVQPIHKQRLLNDIVLESCRMNDMKLLVYLLEEQTQFLWPKNRPLIIILIDMISKRIEQQKRIEFMRMISFRMLEIISKVAICSDVHKDWDLQ